MKCSIFGTVKSRDQAERLIDLLKNIGFAPEDISVLFPDTPGTFTHASKAPEGVSTGGATGFVLGGIFGWLAGIGSLAIPGLGPFIAAGPIMAALSGAAVGAALGGVTGALIGMGIPEYEARKYEAKIRQGDFLISVHTEDEEKAVHAKEIFRISNAEDIAISGEPGITESLREAEETRARRLKTAEAQGSPPASAGEEPINPSLTQEPPQNRPPNPPLE